MTPNTIGDLLASTLLCGGLFFGLATPPAHAQTLEWIRQFGTTEPERSYDIAADSLGYLYISGGFGGHSPIVLPQTELEFSFACVSITPSAGGFHGPSPERIELTGA